MKIAVSGKGGVGKTTVCALLASELHKRGNEVFAVDADPDSSLASCMGYAKADEIAPLVAYKDLIEERTGARPGASGGMFRLNPAVDDIMFRIDILFTCHEIRDDAAKCLRSWNAFA